MTKLKFLSALLVALLVIVPFILAGSFEERGGGRVVTVTSDSQVFDFGQSVQGPVTVFNSGASTTVVFVAVNSTTGQLDTAVAANVALPIRGGLSHTFSTLHFYTNVAFEARAGDGSFEVDITAK